MSARAILRHLLNIRADFDEASIDNLTDKTRFLASPHPIQETDGDGVWHPPSPSTGSRRPPLRSRGSTRGSLVDENSQRELVFESRLERGLAEILKVRRDVRQIFDQPPPVIYRNDQGQARTHTFDFLVVTEGGRRQAIAVKPEAKIEPSGIREILAQIEMQVGARFADDYLLRTERHITHDQVFNARLIARSRRSRDSRDIAAIREIADNLPGSVRIADIVRHSKLGARGFNALVCLIDDAWLEPVGTGRIDYITSVRRVLGI